MRLICSDVSLNLAPFLNIMNEWYVRDTSRKIKSVLRNKGMEGKHLTSNAIYGYKKDPGDNNHWLVNEEAAAVVRRIFQLIIESNGPMQVARILTNEKVEHPSFYLAKQGLGTCRGTHSEVTNSDLKQYHRVPSCFSSQIAAHTKSDTLSAVEYTQEAFFGPLPTLPPFEVVSENVLQTVFDSNRSLLSKHVFSHLIPYCSPFFITPTHCVVNYIMPLLLYQLKINTNP